MLRWSLLNEYYSLCILLVLFVRYYIYERNVAQTDRRRLFVRCLLLSMGYILLNVVCVVALDHPDVVPRWVNIGLNTAYFLASIGLCSLYAFLLFDAMLAHVYDKHCLRRAKIVLLVITSLATVLTLVNLFTGVIFRIDEAGVYQRGPINRIFYCFLLLELFFLCLCYFRNRTSVSDKMLYLIKSLPLIVVFLCVLQFLYPDVLLNGTICAMASLMIYIGFRSNTEDHDALTGVNSRKAFMDELVLRSGNGQSVHLIQVSMLHVGEINTMHGHDVGDAFLYEVAHYLQHCCPNVQVFRTGGTTFTLLLPLRDEQEAESRLSMIRTRLEAAWELGEITCRMPVAMMEMRRENLAEAPSQVVKQVEYAMGLAKSTGSLVRFDETLRDEMDRRAQLLALLRRSIDEGRFRVHYQPLYCCHKDIFCSAEALLRLSDDDGTPISPEVFIPLAEESGLIEEMTWVVLEDICQVLKDERFPGLQSVSINLSMKQLQDPTLPSQIRDRLDRRGIAPSRLKVEITERFLLHDAAYARIQLEELQALGIEVYMDDFGTGYSNLSNVLQFPFSFIKLDRSLIAPVAENQQALAMVRALIKLFGEMGKRVVAEGVEREEQVKLLRELGIDMIQGYYYARPIVQEDLIPYFADAAEKKDTSL